MSISDKIARARKGIRIKNGRALTQREFARLIDYPASKYERAERYDEEVDWALLDKLIRIAHINPYWLFDDECPADLGDFGGADVAMGVEPAILVGLDIVYKWVREGCPRETWWTDTYE